MPMRRSLKPIFSLLLLYVALFGCAATNSVTGTLLVPPNDIKVSIENRKPIDMRRVFIAFVDFCYENALMLDNATKQALSDGYVKQRNGWLEHEEFAMDFTVRDHSTHRTCQFGFISMEPEEEFVKLMKRPFNATELTKNEMIEMFGSTTAAISNSTRDGRLFLGRTTFGGDTQARFLGSILSTDVIATRNAPGRAYAYGFALSVEK